MIFKYITFGIVSSCILFFCYGNADKVFAESDKGKTQGGLINLTVKNNSLRDVIASVSVQSGYSIEISESLLEKSVTGQFADVEIDHFFGRVFRGMNVFQIIDDTSMNIKIYLTKRENERILTITPTQAMKYLELGLDGQPDVTTQDLLDQRTELLQTIDVESIPLDEVSGVSSKDLKEAQQELNETIDIEAIAIDETNSATATNLIKDRDELFERVDVDGLALDGTSGETRRSLEQEREKMYQSIDVDAIPLDEVSGVTLRDLREKQIREIER